MAKATTSYKTSMKIGNIFHKERNDDRAEIIGSLYESMGRAYVELYAFMPWLVCCIPLEHVENVPEVSGDLVFRGDRCNIWCGWIYTESNAEGGAAYQIVLKVDPSPSWFAQQVTRMEHSDRPASHRLILNVE